MRDPALDRGNVYLAALNSACDAARREAEELSDAGSIVAGLADWCRHVLFKPGWMEARGERPSLADLLILPPTRSPLQVLECVPDATRRETLGGAFTGLMEGCEGARWNLPAWLLGKALAKGLVAELSEMKEIAGPLFTRVRNLTESQGVLHRAFEESIREGLHGSPAARSAIRSVLESWIDDINADPGIGAFSRDRSSFRTLVDKWREEPSIPTLWKTLEAPFPVHFRVLEVLPNILPTDRAALLERLDRLSFPEPLRQVLRHHAVLHDRDEIAAALTAAPTCSDDGRSWNRSLLAPLVLQTAENHCRTLWEAVQRTAEPAGPDANATDKVRVTLSSWFEQLGRIVMARPDGHFLGSQWLIMKVADERLDRARHHRAGNQAANLLREVDLIDWIARGLAGAGLTSEEVAILVDFPFSSTPATPAPARPASCDDASRRHRLAGLSVMCLFGQLTAVTPTGEELKLLKSLDALLGSRDPAFESEFHVDVSGHGLPASCFGRLLATEDQPGERWRRSWDLLVEQRRRAQHWSETGDGDALAPSVFLLAVGLAGIDWLLVPANSRRDEARRLWREVFDGARDCWLTISLTHLQERIEKCIGRLFARHPSVFRERLEEECAPEPSVTGDAKKYGTLLARDLDYLGGDDVMLAVCCLNAHKNGASAAVIDDALNRNSGRLNSILRQFDQWQQLEREARRRPEIVKALSGLRAQIAPGENGRPPSE